MSNILPTKRPAATLKAKTGKKQRKWGRNAASCAAYRNSDQRKKNKVRRRDVISLPKRARMPHVISITQHSREGLTHVQ